MVCKVVQKECPRHGLTEFVLSTDGRYHCKKCRSEAVKAARRKIKEKLVEYKGGKCEKCGYDECIGALEFHHLDTDKKEFQISNPNVKSFEKLKKEVDKCILLCSNCHRELHFKKNEEKRICYEREQQKNVEAYKKKHGNFSSKSRVVDKINKDEVLEKTKTMTQKQIADFYGISVSSVKRILKKE